MLYYNNSVEEKYPDVIKYFQSGINNPDKNISHCLLFWGPDITSQCEIALEVARLLNCEKEGEKHCECLNCKWIKEQTHPAVKIYTRLDFKEAGENSDDEKTTGKKNIDKSQAKAIINELGISSDYHRVYIFCDRDEDGNLLPLNKVNFPEVTSNALLKTFEEPPQNTTFIFLTNDKTDIISTVVSRAQAFFIPAKIKEDFSYELVENCIKNYWQTNRNDVLEFENNIMELINSNNPKIIFTQIQNYMSAILKSNFNNKVLYYRIMRDLKYVEEAKRQVSLTPAMNTQTVVENLCFKMIL
ncbi:hypothetical protein IJ579_02965 [bacterium]|nr:hypothetical protein [bacterium]